MNKELILKQKEGAENWLEGNTWLVPPLVENADKAVQELQERMAAAQWTEEEIGNFPLTMAEAVLNGIIHGVFKIKKQEGETKEHFDERIASKQQEIMFNTDGRKLAVKVDIEVGPEEVILKVTDPGDGFVAQTIPDPKDPGRLLEPTGRGVDLMKMLADSVEFRGHTVIVRKKRPGLTE